MEDNRPGQAGDLRRRNEVHVPVEPILGELPMNPENCLVDISKPHWRCICGAVAMPLTDDTKCLCSDIYDQEWVRIDPSHFSEHSQ